MIWQVISFPVFKISWYFLFFQNKKVIFKLNKPKLKMQKTLYLKLNNHLPIYILTSAMKFKEHSKGFSNV